jgi:regulator of sigma E protease
MKNSAAEKAGLRIGDLVVEVEGNRIKTWQNLILEIQLAGHDGLLEAVIDRNGERIPIRINISDSRDEFALLGFPREDVIVGQVTAGKPAEQAGLQRDDRILSINGEEVLSRFHFSEKIQEAGGAPVVLDILRGGEPLQIKVRPIHGDPGDGVRRWQIGFSFGQINVLRSYPPHEAVVRAVAFNYRMTKEILNIIGQLLRGKVSLKQLEGPVGIARQSGQAAKLGLIPLTFLTAVISLNLGILNLLPIPILDGGLILLLAVEGLRRRDFSIRVKEWYVQVGMVLLLVIFTAVMYNDLKKLLPLP